jgi:hypothetical protein
MGQQSLQQEESLPTELRSSRIETKGGDVACKWRRPVALVSVRMTRSTIPFCYGQCGVMNS